jgi:hypothetical protein
MKIKQVDYPTQEPIGGPIPADTSIVQGAIDRAASTISRGIGSAAQGFGELAHTIEKVAKEKQRVSQTTKLGELRVSAEKEYLAWKEDFDRSGPNPDTYVQDNEKAYDKIINNTLKQTQDRHVQDAFKITMNQHKLEILNAATREENRLWIDKNLSEKMGQIDAYVKLAGDSTDAALYSSYKTSARAVVQSMSGNLLHKEKARELEASTMKEIDTAQVRNQQTII